MSSMIHVSFTAVSLRLIRSMAFPPKAPPGAASIRQVALAHRFRNLSPHLPRIWTRSSASQDLGSRVKPRPQEPSSRRTGAVYCVVLQQLGYQVIASSYALSIQITNPRVPLSIHPTKTRVPERALETFPLLIRSPLVTPAYTTVADHIPMSRISLYIVSDLPLPCPVLLLIQQRNIVL